MTQFVAQSETFPKMVLFDQLTNQIKVVVAHACMGAYKITVGTEVAIIIMFAPRKKQCNPTPVLAVTMLLTMLETSIFVGFCE